MSLDRLQTFRFEGSKSKRVHPDQYLIDALRQAFFYPSPTGLPFSLLVLALYAVACVGVGAFLVRRSRTIN